MALSIDCFSDSRGKWPVADDRFFPPRKYTLAKQGSLDFHIPSYGTIYTKYLNAVFSESFPGKILRSNPLTQGPPIKTPPLKLPPRPRKCIRLTRFSQDFYTNNLDWNSTLLVVNGKNTTYGFDIEAEKQQRCLTSDNLLTCVKWSHHPSRFGCGDLQSILQVIDLIAEKSTFRSFRIDAQQIMSLDWRNSHEVTIGTNQQVFHLDLRFHPRFQTPAAIAPQSSSSGAHRLICALTWHNDGFLFATGSDEDLVKVFDIRRSVSTNHLHTHTHQAAVKALQWVPNTLQPTLLSGGGKRCGTLKVVNINTHEILCEAFAHAQISSVAFLAKRVFVAGLGYPLTKSKHKLQLWHLNLSRERLVKISEEYEDEARIFNISKKPNSNSFAALSENGLVSIWNVTEPVKRKESPFLEQQTIRKLS